MRFAYVRKRAPATVNLKCLSRRSSRRTPNSSSNAATRLDMADWVKKSFSAARVTLLSDATQ